MHRQDVVVHGADAVRPLRAARIPRHQYYRAAAAARERKGCAPCATASGRTVYGGGGIFPDALLTAPPAPALWLQRAIEAELPLNSVAGYVEAHGAAWRDVTVISREDVALDAVASFRTFADMDPDIDLAAAELPRAAELLRRR